MPFTQEQITRARRADLVAYLSAHGHRLRRDGRGQYRLVGHGGLIITSNMWFQFSENRGGNAVDLLVHVLGLPFPQAVEELLPYAPNEDQPAPPPAPIHLRPVSERQTPGQFALPPKSPDAKRLAHYLTRVRRLPSTLVGELMARTLLYQDVAGHCVFVCRDISGQPRAALRVGTDSRHPFKGLSPGSDSSYGWWWPPEEVPCPPRIVVVSESPIDACSLAVLRPGLRHFHFLSLNGLRAGALQTFLADHPEVRTVILGLDNDSAGQEASARFREELAAKRYAVAVLKPPEGSKDWNEALVARR